MIQSRTHNCNELRIGNVGERVTLVGWFENMRKVSKNLGFVILRDFYGITQLVVETEEMMNVMDGINKESTISESVPARTKTLRLVRSKLFRRRSKFWENVFTMHFPLKSISPRMQTKMLV